MTIQTVTDAIRYVGVDDNTLALFENQYPVQPMGVSYNSYVILDEKIAVMDSVDARATEEWLSNVARVLEGRRPDYLVVTHMEPDHSGPAHEGVFGTFTDKGIPKPPDRPHGKRLLGPCRRAADARQIGGDEGYPPLRNGSVSAWCIEPNQ